MKNLFRLFIASLLILCVPLTQVALALEPDCPPCAEAQGNSTITIAREPAKVQQSIVASYKSEYYRNLLENTRNNKLSVMSSDSFVVSIGEIDGVLAVPVSNGITKGYIYNIPQVDGYQCAISFLVTDGNVTATLSDYRGVRSMDFPQILPNSANDEMQLLSLTCQQECTLAFAGGCSLLCAWWGIGWGVLCSMVCALGALNSCNCICDNIGCPTPPDPPTCGLYPLPDCE